MTKPTTIRLTDEEKADAMRKAESLGITTLADLIRHAIKKLRVPQ